MGQLLEEAYQVCLCAKYFEVHHMKQGYNIHSTIFKEME